MDMQPPRHVPYHISGKQFHPRAGSQAEGSVQHARDEDGKPPMAVLALGVQTCTRHSSMRHQSLGLMDLERRTMDGMSNLAGTGQHPLHSILALHMEISKRSIL